MVMDRLNIEVNSEVLELKMRETWLALSTDSTANVLSF
jgi:hypothetical protein